MSHSTASSTPGQVAGPFPADTWPAWTDLVTVGLGTRHPFEHRIGAVKMADAYRTVVERADACACDGRDDHDDDEDLDGEESDTGEFPPPVPVGDDEPRPAAEDAPHGPTAADWADYNAWSQQLEARRLGLLAPIGGGARGPRRRAGRPSSIPPPRRARRDRPRRTSTPAATATEPSPPPRARPARGIIRSHRPWTTPESSAPSAPSASPATNWSRRCRPRPPASPSWSSTTPSPSSPGAAGRRRSSSTGRPTAAAPASPRHHHHHNPETHHHVDPPTNPRLDRPRVPGDRDPPRRGPRRHRRHPPAAPRPRHPARGGPGRPGGVERRARPRSAATS